MPPTVGPLGGVGLVAAGAVDVVLAGIAAVGDLAQRRVAQRLATARAPAAARRDRRPSRAARRPRCRPTTPGRPWHRPARGRHRGTPSGPARPCLFSLVGSHVALTAVPRGAPRMSRYGARMGAGERWNERYAQGFAPFADAPATWLVAARRGCSTGGGRALDVACGDGRNALYLARARLRCRRDRRLGRRGRRAARRGARARPGDHAARRRPRARAAAGRAVRRHRHDELPAARPVRPDAGRARAGRPADLRDARPGARRRAGAQLQPGLPARGRRAPARLRPASRSSSTSTASPSARAAPRGVGSIVARRRAERGRLSVPVTIGAPREPIALTVIGGFLGAGKTTLLNRLLRDAGDRRLAVLVNDFGAINIDAELVQSRDGADGEPDERLHLLRRRGDFIGELALLRDRPDPPRTSSSRPAASPTRRDRRARRPARLPQGRGGRRRRRRDRARARRRRRRPVTRSSGQLRAADLLVLNKTDLVEAEQLAADARLAARDRRAVDGDRRDLVRRGAGRRRARRARAGRPAHAATSTTTGTITTTHEHDHHPSFETWSWSGARRDQRRRARRGAARRCPTASCARRACCTCARTPPTATCCRSSGGGSASRPTARGAMSRPRRRSSSSSGCRARSTRTRSMRRSRG